MGERGLGHAPPLSHLPRPLDLHVRFELHLAREDARLLREREALLGEDLRVSRRGEREERSSTRGEHGEKRSMTHGPAPPHLGLVRLQLQLFAHLPVFNLHAGVHATGSPTGAPILIPLLPSPARALCPTRVRESRLLAQRASSHRTLLRAVL